MVRFLSPEKGMVQEIPLTPDFVGMGSFMISM
jgi:hypothetical protein